MPALSPEAFLAFAKSAPTLDVRSPAEFAAGHMPGAVSMPLFSNEERGIVGTAYQQLGHLPAYQIGLEIVGPKMAGFVKQATELAGEGNPIGLYCWRGGMRSGSVGWLLSQGGFIINTLRGGYKAYRTYVQSHLEKAWPLVVLGGPTGSGKTDVLKAMAAKGTQVIDLEGLANHKGSAFGGIGQAAQPRIEMFENELVARLLAFDTIQPIWVEDESQSIGHVFIYGPFFEQMRRAPFFRLNTAFEVRVERLVTEYAGLPDEELVNAIGKIAKRMGPQHAKVALECLKQGNYADVARIALAYYDKAYAHNLRPSLSDFQLDTNNTQQAVDYFLELITKSINVAQ